MTREQLHSTQGFHPASVRAAAQYLLNNMPRKPVLPEPTALIRNEGFMNGFLTAIEHLEAVTAPKVPDAPKKEFQAYAPPTENQNRP